MSTKEVQGVEGEQEPDFVARMGQVTICERKDHLERASRGGKIKVRISIQTPASNEKLLHLLLVPPAAERAALG